MNFANVTKLVIPEGEVSQIAQDGTVLWQNRLYLYKDGDECVGVTGGWMNPALTNEWGCQDCRIFYGSQEQKYERKKEPTYLHLYVEYGRVNDSCIASFRPTNSISLNGYKHLCIEADVFKDADANTVSPFVYMSETASDGTQSAYFSRGKNLLNDGITKLELPKRDRSFISILVAAQRADSSGTPPMKCGLDIHKVWLE